MVANLSLDKQPPPLDVEAVRRDFPILTTKVHGYPLVYLDSAASSQRALPVLRAVEEYERHSHANVHLAGEDRKIAPYRRDIEWRRGVEGHVGDHHRSSRSASSRS